MIPPQREFERVPTDDFINAEISDVIYDEQHEFSVFHSDEKELGFGVQFVLNIAGLQKPKKTRWYKFNYDERSNLYKFFIAPLVQGAEPYMTLDLDLLKGMQIKMLWRDDKDPRYQSIETIRPAGKKIVPPIDSSPKPVFDQRPPNDDEVPF